MEIAGLNTKCPTLVMIGKRKSGANKRTIIHTQTGENGVLDKRKRLKLKIKAEENPQEPRIGPG
jgi:hypothetical protein